MSSTTANTVSKSNTATIAPSATTNAISSKKMTSSGSKAVGAGAGVEQATGGQQQPKPSAWSRTSVNPITGRPSGSPVQNGVRSNGAGPVSQVKLPQTAANDVKPTDKLSLVFAGLQGSHVTVTMKNGDCFTGIFSSRSDNRYMISMAKKQRAPGRQANGVASENVGSGPDRTLALSMDEVLSVTGTDVRLDKSATRAQNGAASSFRTDTDISSGWRGRERDLQKWEGDDSSINTDMSLENGHAGGWDQFAAHKQMTGLDSTYDESHYTTTINRSRPGFEEAQKKADRIAREIEGSSATNAHVAEERGLQQLDDSGLDEEAKYSGVQREYKPLPAGSANRYTPPAMRAPTGQATVPGAPVDPAIISSSFAKTKPSSPAPAAKAEVPVADVAKPTVAKEASAPATVVSKPADKAIPSLAAAKPTVPAPIPASRPANREGGATATVEKDVAEAFKEFSKNERLKIQEHQRSAARKDKAVKLNDLKKFAQNFKLHTEVPADLLPILARDETKQQEIKMKAKKNAEDKSTPPRSTSTSVAATPSQPATKPPASRNDSGPTSPLVTVDKSQQRSRQSSQNMGGLRGPAPQMQSGGHGGSNHRTPGTLGSRLQTNLNRGGMPLQHPGPIPGPHMQSQNVTSPSLRFDPGKTFVPSSASRPFVPGGSNASSSSSPVRAPSSQPFEQKQPTPGNLFAGRTDGRKEPVPENERITLDNAFNPIPTLRAELAASTPEGTAIKNDGIPFPYKTPPTWEDLVPQANREKTVKDMFPSTLKPAASPQYPSQHQFPGQLPGYGPQGGYPQQQGFTPNQTPRHMVVQPHHGSGTPHHMEDAQRMQFSHSNPPVHPSPRPMPGFVYNASGHQQPHFQGQPVMAYGTSPGGGYPMIARQHSNNPQFPGQGPQMMMGQPPMYQNGMPAGQVVYGPNGQPVFLAQAHMMGPQPGANNYPSPANRAAMMVPTSSQSGHNTPAYGTPFMQAGGPVPQGMRYGGPQHHPQFVAGQPHHFMPQQQHMRGGAPAGQFSQQMLGGPQGMPVMAQASQDGGDENK